MSSLWWRSRTAHCWLLVRGRMSGVRSWSVHDSPCPLHALLGPRDRDNRFLSRFLKQQIIHPALLRGRDALSRSSSLSLWVARPEASCSSAYRQLTGARTGGAACVHLAQQHRFWWLLRMLCGSGGGCRGPSSVTSRLGAATGGRVEAAARSVSGS